MCNCQAKKNVCKVACAETTTETEIERATVPQLNFEIEEKCLFEYLKDLAKRNVFPVAFAIDREANADKKKIAKHPTDIVQVHLVTNDYATALRIIRRYKIKNFQAVMATIMDIASFTEFKEFIGGLGKDTIEDINITSAFFNNEGHVVYTTTDSQPILF